MPIKDETILEILTSYNQWWQTGEVDSAFVKKFKRQDFYRIFNFLKQKELRRTIVLSGLRRVGKTTILYQLIDKLIQNGVEPEKIVYISFDHPLLKDIDIKRILDIYHSNIYQDKDVYYIFDEIQYVSNWDRWLKYLYDQQPHTQVIATGSASPILLKGQQESGVGRWFNIQIPTLSFFEYCELLGVQRPDIPEDFSLDALSDLDQFQFNRIKMQLKNVQEIFNRYLLTGGFPETALIENTFLAQQMLREDVINKVIYSDLPQLYNLRNVRDLNRIFLYLCDISSDIVSFDTISRELKGVSRPTVEKYIRYLESANLIYLSWPINLEGKKILKAQPKIYLADSAIAESIRMKNPHYLTTVEMGKLVESAVYKHVISLNSQFPISIGYFRDSKNKRKVDVVVENNFKEYDLIEVKFRENPKVTKKDAIISYNRGVKRKFVITKNSEDFRVSEVEGEKIVYIPAYAFLYLSGWVERNDVV